MLFWVCVDDKPIALPTKDAEEAKHLALEHLNDRRFGECANRRLSRQLAADGGQAPLSSEYAELDLKQANMSSR